MMYTTEKLYLENQGNATAYFNFKARGKKSKFKVDPMEGEVKSGCKKTVLMYYYPKGKLAKND